jgi:iron complex transport system substrate-binding protein
MEQGKVPDVGYGQNLNYELMVNLKPDLVMVYGIGSEVTSYTGKLEELGIPVVMVAEYLEESPLGKAEWIKFIGALFEKEQMAGEYFQKIEKEYNRLKRLFRMKMKCRKCWWALPIKMPGGFREGIPIWQT